MFYILAHSIPLQKVYFFSDNFTFAYAIQGFVERYLANEIELINIVYFHTQADKQRYTANQVLSETVQNLNETGLNNFDFIQPVVITGRQELKQMSIEEDSAIITIFNSTISYEKFEENPIFTNRLHHNFFNLHLPYHDVHLMQDYFMRIKALRYNRDTLGVYIKAYRSHLKKEKDFDPSFYTVPAHR